jgi:hypothetical protein
MEGSFILRYRCFDLFSKVAGQDTTPVWAECYGGAFRVYSTKEFPGLRASTDLTKVRRWFRLPSAGIPNNPLRPLVAPLIFWRAAKPARDGAQAEKEDR